MKQLDTVFYRDFADGDLTVLRVKSEQAAKYAQGIRLVLSEAYAREFEQKRQDLSPGTSRTHFIKPDHLGVSEQLERMKASMERGSSYWVASRGRYLGRPDGGILGVAKTSPSKPRIGRFFGIRNCFVNDVAVMEPHMRVGSTLLYSALADFDDNSKVLLDALPGTIESWEKLGFNEKPSIHVPDLEIADESLPQVRMEAAAVDDVRAALAQQHGWLSEGSEYFS